MPFKSAIDVLFARLGRDAVYYPVHGPSQTIRVMPRRPDQLLDGIGARIHSDTTVIDVRVSEVAQPQSGDVIDLDNELLEVQGEPRREDVDRLIWTLDTRPR